MTEINIYSITAKPPEELTEEDVALCVARLREMRKDYVAAQAKGERAGAKIISPEDAAGLFKDLL